MNISIHSMLVKYVLAHVSLLALFFMAACEDSSSSAWTRSSANRWGSIFKCGLLIGLSGCGLPSSDLCAGSSASARPPSLNQGC